uniref:Uncharacterized protein n=2 Tax=Anguilla anguilla TaxID=7936 RepID=A0A0E9QDD8_ANGAN
MDYPPSFISAIISLHVLSCGSVGHDRDMWFFHRMQICLFCFFCVNLAPSDVCICLYTVSTVCTLFKKKKSLGKVLKPCGHIWEVLLLLVMWCICGACVNSADISWGRETLQEVLPCAS